MCEYIIAEDFTMDKYIFNENNSLWYELVGDYYFPCLAVPAEEEQPVGVWGQRHKRYLKEHPQKSKTDFQCSPHQKLL